MITCGPQMFGDQGGILVNCLRVARFDSRGQPSMHLRTIGFQLRFVGHRANKRVAEGVSGGWGESHLIDQLRVQ